MKDDSSRVDVGGDCGLTSNELFGGHVLRSAERGAYDAPGGAINSTAAVRCAPRIPDKTGDAEVGDLEDTVGAKENVLRLQVAMNDLLLMRGRKRTKQLLCDRDGD